MTPEIEKDSQPTGDPALASASGSDHYREIRCEECGEMFDVFKAKVGDRILENSLSGLKDINNPWAECPHCGCRI
jgi:DNA-directed RNA polymerase subunit RPC12/RpoP